MTSRRAARLAGQRDRYVRQQYRGVVLTRHVPGRPSMTPTEAVAAALKAAPNVTGSILRGTTTDRVEVAKAAGMLATALGQATGRVWSAEDVEALAEGIAGSRPA